MTHRVHPPIKPLCGLIVVLFSLSLVQAQEFRGLIIGQVTDQHGAVVPNVMITATGPQQKYTTKTNGSGN